MHPALVFLAATVVIYGEAALLKAPTIYPKPRKRESIRYYFVGTKRFRYIQRLQRKTGRLTHAASTNP